MDNMPQNPELIGKVHLVISAIDPLVSQAKVRE
jgi:hypothetical protein